MKETSGGDMATCSGIICGLVRMVATDLRDRERPT